MLITGGSFQDAPIQANNLHISGGIFVSTNAAGKTHSPLYRARHFLRTFCKFFNHLFKFHGRALSYFSNCAS